MLTAGGTIESRVRQVRRSIGLSPKQATSLHAAREALFAYLASPARAVPMLTDEARASRAGYMRLADPKAILAKGAAHLSAPQRAMLLKAMTPNLDEAAAEKLLNRHAAALSSFRARTLAGHELHSLAERAKLVAWKAAQRVGVLSGNQRRFWQTAGDERVRQSHSQVPAMNASGVPLDKPFATPLGETMFPPLEINCRCKAVLRQPA